MSSIQSHSQTPRSNTNHAVATASRSETFCDIELGELPPQRSSTAVAQPATRLTPAAPAAVSYDDERVIDPRSCWIAGWTTLGGLVIGAIAAGAYAGNKASARSFADDPCWTDDNGDSHCNYPDNSTHGSIIAVSLLVPTLCLAALAVGGLACAGKWTITRGDLRRRREAAAQQASNQSGSSGTYNPAAGAAAQAQAAQSAQAWNQGVQNDLQAFGNGQQGAGYLPQPFSW